MPLQQCRRFCLAPLHRQRVRRAAVLSPRVQVGAGGQQLGDYLRAAPAADRPVQRRLTALIHLVGIRAGPQQEPHSVEGLVVEHVFQRVRAL
jgi:hypothetical protein